MPKVRARLEVVKGTKQRPYPREMRHGRLLVVDGMTRKNNRRGPEGVCPKGGTMTPDEKRIVEWLRQCRSNKLAHHREVCFHESDEILDSIITAAQTFEYAADAIERGAHRKD